MKYIKKLLFGERCEPVDTISTGVHTIPYNQPSFDEWCKEFNVSLLYDKKVIYIS